MLFIADMTILTYMEKPNWLIFSVVLFVVHSNNIKKHNFTINMQFLNVVKIMRKILIIDNSRPTKNGGIGGSINSMLQLIARINKTQFKIYVLLYYKLPLLEKQLRKIEVTMIYKSNSLPLRTNNFKQKRLVAS